MTHVLPWYIAGPLIGLFVPILLLTGNRLFGVSSSFRHICAATMSSRADYFRYDWRATGAWNIAFAAGILLGGFLVQQLGAHAAAIAITPAARASLGALGIHDFSGMAPQELFSWHALTTLRGVVMIGGGGMLVGFGAAYAGGCTSGHAISGLADRQLPSLLAVVGFFAGGLVGAWFVLPMLLGSVAT
jgi:uncharacterized protein